MLVSIMSLFSSSEPASRRVCVCVCYVCHRHQRYRVHVCVSLSSSIPPPLCARVSWLMPPYHRIMCSCVCACLVVDATPYGAHVCIYAHLIVVKATVATCSCVCVCGCGLVVVVVTFHLMRSARVHECMDGACLSSLSALTMTTTC